MDILKDIMENNFWHNIMGNIKVNVKDSTMNRIKINIKDIP